MLNDFILANEPILCKRFHNYYCLYRRYIACRDIGIPTMQPFLKDFLKPGSRSAEFKIL